MNVFICGSAAVSVEYVNYALHVTTEMFYDVERERGYFHLVGKEILLAIRTSRIINKINKINGGWRQSVSS
jgi:hypothetical protein